MAATFEDTLKAYDLDANKPLYRAILKAHRSRSGLKKQKRRIGLSFWRWFYSTGNETTEDAIERITGVKDRRFDAKTKE